MKLRNIYSFSKDKLATTKGLIYTRYHIDLSEADGVRMYDLIYSFLCKSTIRKPIDIELSKKLLVIQNNECAICHCTIKSKYHTDHIVPFKYVGDELRNNLQILCQHCNNKKSQGLDYQIKYLLKLL